MILYIHNILEVYIYYGSDSIYYCNRLGAINDNNRISLSLSVAMVDNLMTEANNPSCDNQLHAHNHFEATPSTGRAQYHLETKIEQA